MDQYEGFAFIEPGVLKDGELELRLIRTILHPPESNHAPEYNFGMDLASGQKDIGGINIRMGHSNSLKMYRGQIGYSVDEEYRGNHYAARSLKMVLPIFAKHGFKQVYVTCNPENIASIRSLEMAGAKFIECVDVPPEEPPFQRGEKQKNRYVFSI
jgi:predicted acetyltransferase